MTTIYKEIDTRNFGLEFLRIAKEYCLQKNIGNKLDQAIKIIIFSVAANEAIANMESMNYFTGRKLEKFIRYGPKEDKRKKISLIVKKWNFLLTKYKVGRKRKDAYLANLSSLITIRNELLHFKAHKNQTEKILMPKKNKIIGPDGQFYTSFRKTEFRLLKRGILNKLTLGEARKHYENTDNFIFDFYSHKKIWPSPNFSNKHWGKRSPFWKYRKQYKYTKEKNELI